eukprot:gnl/MRDRNA2_/MRDRNA2_172977_c0_seq1.p1 gnl/MRDRNA2_/MRDRNA2_172977_c0~~gnl/MRDRNA2_/MRDRNA2_172977_c0_seq1.p1  ORF type:complete len:290 (+),score=40.44 gnl/MRDRNA2_/MRDRNA2_172977_c0_seq1:82-870(+)
MARLATVPEKSYRTAIEDWSTRLNDYQKRMLSLQSLEKVPDMAEEANFFNERLNSFLYEFKTLPKMNQFLILVVVWKLFRVMFAVIDDGLQKLVVGTTLSTKMMMSSFCLPGVALIIYFWSSITKNMLIAQNGYSGPDGAFQESGFLLHKFQALIANCRRLPRMFWVATGMASLVALQMVEAGIQWLIETLSRDHQMLQILMVAVVLVSQFRKQWIYIFRWLRVSVEKMCRLVLLQLASRKERSELTFQNTSRREFQSTWNA